MKCINYTCPQCPKPKCELVCENQTTPIADFIEEIQIKMDIKKLQSKLMTFGKKTIQK